jgi:hypothetical protein
MQPSQMAYNNPWVMGGASQSMLGGHSGSMSYGNPWMLMPLGAEAGPRHDNVARASWRHKRKEYDVTAASRTTSGHKPNTLRIKEGGDIDGGCSGKNAWDDAVKSLVPLILDLSVIEWEGKNLWRWKSCGMLLMPISTMSRSLSASMVSEMPSNAS